MNTIIEKIEKLKKSDDAITNLIAKEIYNNFIENIFLSGDEIANKCFVSKSTITNFSKKYGVSGYRELISRLKFEKSFILRKNDINDEFNLSSKNNILKILEWIEKNINFIENICDLITVNKSLTIFSSFQSLDACKYFKKILQAIDIDVKIIDSYCFIDKKHVVNKNEINIFLICGRDNSYLINAIINGIFDPENKKKFIITTLNQIDKIQFKWDSKLFIDYQFDDHDYPTRNLAFQMLFFKMYNILQNNTF